jgi:tetratricopeptide (TPR) repeat protein
MATRAPEPTPPEREVVDAAQPVAHAALGAPLLPRPGQLFPQSQVRLAEGDPRDAERLADVEACGACHEDVLEGWRASAHGRASLDNPWYRQAFDALREERGPVASRFCAGCHDPVLLVSGGLDQPIEPEDARAHAGVTCLTCHGMQEVRPDGVASYTLSTRGVHLPDPADAASVARHVREVTPDALRTTPLCATCHRGFLGPHLGNPVHLVGIDDVTAWHRSGYAGSGATRLDQGVEPATCQGCHMPERQAAHGDLAADPHGRIHSHRFPGAHTALADAAGDAAQLEEARALLTRAARIDVAVVRARGREAVYAPADAARIMPGERLELDVVVHNLGAGHRFPGGTLDTQDTWIELEVRDTHGALVAEAGAQHARTSADPTAHRLHALLVNEEGVPERRHHVQHFRGAVADHTLGPRDAGLARFRLELPSALAQPLSVRARLRHRRHDPALAEAACDAQRTPRGAAFRQASRGLGRAPLDACRPQPITELAEALVWIGAGAEEREPLGGATAPRWRRLFDHAMASVGDVQEHLDDARPSLHGALAAAPDAPSRAMVLAQRARLEGRQGRLEAALTDLAEAERLVGPRPALHRLRGDAYAQVWQWERAAEAYAAAAEGAPLDDTRWADLARARGSAGDDRGAYGAARRGLALQPRDEVMLRSQYLALEGLDHEDAAAAREAYLAHRSPDALSELRFACGRRDPLCASERLPVRVHVMRRAR